MKKFVAILMTVVSLVTYLPVWAIHETTDSVNQRYSDFIWEAIEKSEFGESELDKDNIYIIEKSNITFFRNDGELYEFYIAIPIKNTDDIAYSIFRNGEYAKEVLNPASMLYIENYMNTKIDQYIEDNNLINVTEVVSTIFYGRRGINSYRVIADGETYFIPYYIEFEYNLADDEECALELGKAYKADDFVEKLEKESISFHEYKEAERKAEEERAAAEAEAEAEKYRPTISLDENGDEVVKVNGINLDDILSEFTDRIEQMKFGSTIKFGIKTEKENYLATYRCRNGCDITEVIEFAEGLFDELKTQVTTGKPNTAQNVSYCKFNNNAIISVWDDGVEIQLNKEEAIEFKVKNADAIISYMNRYGDDAFDGFTYEKIDENTPDIRGNLDGLTKTDVIEFECKLPANADNSLTKEVASPGKTITGTFERYKENKYRSTYILTLSGDLGTISLYKENQSSLSGEDEYFSNNIPLSFFNTFRYENGNLVEYKIGKDSTTYELKMVFKGNDISEVYFDNTECIDLKYTQLTEDTKLSDEYVEKDKEAIIREAKECVDTLYDFGLFKGTDKGYELEKSLTREESATILVRLLGEEEKLNANDYAAVFSDVEKDRWSYAYVMYCYENNITKGTSSSTFLPEAQIDAEQFVALLMRLLGYTDAEPNTALDMSVAHNLLPADMAEELKDADVFTRSEMVQIVYNSLKTQMADETVFSDYLLYKGILTEEEIGEIK